MTLNNAIKQKLKRQPRIEEEEQYGNKAKNLNICNIIVLGNYANAKPQMHIGLYDRKYVRPEDTNIFVPGYLGIMVTREQQFCCILAATKEIVSL